MGDLVERAKSEAMELRIGVGTPVRVLERDGVVIWSKVDDHQRDLTPENSDGLLYHVRSLFVPHGAESPLDQIESLRAALASSKSGWTGKACPECNGTGIQPSCPTDSTPCKNCGGTGEEYIDAALAPQDIPHPQTHQICRICDGGPGNDGVCLCGERAWE